MPHALHGAAEMLTERELYILLLRHQGLTQTDIAAQLKITQGVVSRSEASARRKVIDAQGDLTRLTKLGIVIQAPTLRDEELLDRARRRSA